MESKVEQIKSFLGRYEEFLISTNKDRVHQFKAKFEQVLNGFRPLKEKLKERSQFEGIYFNIFDILNINYAETITHTPFLTNLLDPKGTHGQNDLFIDQFIRKFVPDSKIENFLLSDADHYDVTEEKVFPDGRIDTFIISMDSAQNFGIVIENKLFAADQPNQIYRYYSYLADQLGYPDEAIMIFYLTIGGSMPSEDSINETMRDRLIENQILKNISYRIDIRKWLERSLQNIKANNVKVLVRQYLHTIDNM